MKALAERLTELGFTELFQRLDDDALEAAWNDAGPKQLIALAADRNAPLLPRFLAAEILFHKHAAVPEDVVDVYVAALRDSLVVANHWAYPDGSLGSAGEHLVSFGKRAAALLAPVLGDERGVGYEGSEEATMSNVYRFRIKDLAALLIGRITSLPFPDSRDRRTRDAAIDSMKARLS